MFQYHIKLFYLRCLILLGFIDKPEGEIMGLRYWRWDFWNSECRFSIWSDSFIWVNPFGVITKKHFNKLKELKRI